MADVSLERRAAVRASNLEIVREAEQGDFGSRVPLICECGDVACVGFARMEVDGFNVAATQPSWFIVGDAHGARYAVVDAETGDEVLRIAYVA